MKHLTLTVIAVALAALSSPAFATGKTTVGGTSAFSKSNVGVANCDCPGKSSAQAIAGNVSFGTATVGGGSQKSVTGSTSFGSGKSHNGHFLGVGSGGSDAFTKF